MARNDAVQIAKNAAAGLRRPEPRGLAGLLPTRPGTSLDEARMLPLELLAPNPYQPRRTADVAAQAELVEDIRQRGILQPILVRLVEGAYQVVAGERRYQAARVLGLEIVPTILLNVSDEEARIISLVENTKRENLSPPDEGRYYQALRDEYKWSLRDTADAVGKSHMYVKRRLDLVDDPAALHAWEQGIINLDDVRALAPADLERSYDVPMDELAEETGAYMGAVGATGREQNVTGRDSASVLKSVTGRDTSAIPPRLVTMTPLPGQRAVASKKEPEERSAGLYAAAAALKMLQRATSQLRRLTRDDLLAADREQLMLGLDELTAQAAVIRNILEPAGENSN